MKTISLIFFCFFCSAAIAQKKIKSPADNIPAASGYVTDGAHILSVKEKAGLEAKLKTFEASTPVEIAVVTVNTTGNLSIEDFAAKLFKKWGIGKKDKNNGVLLLVAYKDRKVRIATGSGIVQKLTDSSCKTVIDEIMVPKFKTNDFYEGIDEAVDKIENILNGTAVAPDDAVSQATTPLAASYTYDTRPPDNESNKGFWITITIIAIGIIFYIVRRFSGVGYWVSPSYPYDDYNRGYYGHRSNDNTVADYTSYSSMSSSSSDSGSASSPDFGGGDTDGGGASGSW